MISRFVGRRLARLATVSVTGRPVLWRLFRPLLRMQFQGLAPRWDSLRRPGHLGALEEALAGVHPAPERALDVGTGTGDAALAIAARWPGADVVGIDLSPGMVAEARRKTPPELAGRVRFETADASALPYPSAAFDLVVLANAIPFFDELARVLAPTGMLVFAFSAGSSTPIYVPPERLRRELVARGLTHIDEVAAGAGTALLARRAPSE